MATGTICCCKITVTRTHRVIRSIDKQAQTLMDAVTSKLEAMVLTHPDRNTKSGKKQASCLYYRHDRAKKAKYNAEYYKKHQYSINCNKVVKRGNSRIVLLAGR